MKKRGLLFFGTILMTLILGAVSAGAMGYFSDLIVTSQYTDNDYYSEDYSYEYPSGREFEISTRLSGIGYDEIEPDIIIALYDENGRLLSAKFTDKDSRGAVFGASATFDGIEGGNILAKAFAWNMDNLCPKAEIAQANVTAININPTATAVINPGDIADMKYNADGFRIKTNDDNTYYINEESCSVYINGVEIREDNVYYATGLDIVNEYYWHNNGSSAEKGTTLGDIRLEDNDEDGEYDALYAEIGKSFVVKRVEENSLEFDTEQSQGASPLLIEENKEYKYFMGDDEIELSDIKPFDVVTVFYDLNTFYDYSEFYNIHVSRNAVSGIMTACSYESVSIDGVEYKRDYKYPRFTVGDKYIVTLDIAGNARGFYHISTKSADLGIIEDVYAGPGGVPVISMLLPDGTKNIYCIDAEDFELYRSYITDKAGEELLKNSDKFGVCERVYSCEIQPSGNMSIKDKAAVKKHETAVYDGDKIGEIAISDTTNIINYSKEYGANRISKNNLEENGEYDAYEFESGESSFVIIMASEANDQTFVIFSKKTENEGKTVYTVYEPGLTEPTELVLENSIDITLDEGDPIVVKKNKAGEVTEAKKLFEVNLNEGYSSFAIAAREALNNNEISSIINTANADDMLTSKKSGWVFGAVYDRSNNYVTLATADDFDGNYQTNVWNLTDYDLYNDADILVYDYSAQAGEQNRVSIGSINAVYRLVTVRAAFTDPDKDTILNWNDATITQGEGEQYGRTSFMFAKIIDGGIVEAYVINPSSNKN